MTLISSRNRGNKAYLLRSNMWGCVVVGTLWITGECLYLCLSKCQHFVPYKQFKIYRFKQVYGALCKPNHHKMYRYWEIQVKILCIMWMRSQGASSSTTIIQQKKSSTTIHIFLSIKEFTPVVQNFMEKVYSLNANSRRVKSQVSTFISLFQGKYFFFSNCMWVYYFK